VKHGFAWDLSVSHGLMEGHLSARPQPSQKPLPPVAWAHRSFTYEGGPFSACAERTKRQVVLRSGGDKTSAHSSMLASSGTRLVRFSKLRGQYTIASLGEADTSC